MLGEASRWDATLVALARADAALRLRLGQVLAVLRQRAGYSQLGFSSLSAYALERCERSTRWAEDSLSLARRLEGLPVLRRALASGELSWSMAELVARVAQPADELRWLEAGRSHTVRQMRQQVQAAQRTATQQPAGQRLAQEGEEEWGGTPAQHSADPQSSPVEEEPCTLTCTVNREDAWLFEATQKLLDQLGTSSTEAQVEALLAEAQETLLGALPRGAIDPEMVDSKAAAQLLWREQLRRWQAEAEQRCEAHVWASARRGADPQSDVSRAASTGCASLEAYDALELDACVRELSLALARQDFELSRCVLAFHRADGWRRLGYATESQYARERLGWSRSSLVARRALAARLERLPAVARALAAAHIGVEAALQLVRVATPRTELAWVERAQQRTIKHLREEVAAALTAVRLSGEAACPPPVERELDAFVELERAVVSGRACEPRAQPVLERTLGKVRALVPPGSDSRRAWLITLASLAQWLERGVETKIQMSGVRTRSIASAGRIELRLRISRGLCTWWRVLEAQARRWLPGGMSWLKFLCLSVWRAWRHVLGVNEAYGAIYLRDAYRCRSPVCSRRDVTPHHLRFRSRGGGDEPANLASVCTWCHLFGIHGGRIRAQGTAESIRWELGPSGHPCVVVEGRERLVA